MNITEMNFTDMNLQTFTERLFSAEPFDPFSIELSETDKMADTLGYVLMNGCKIKYGCSPHELKENQIMKMKEYFWSIGWSVDYESVNVKKEVTDYHKNGEAYKRDIVMTTWKITFSKAPRTNMGCLKTKSDF